MKKILFSIIVLMGVMSVYAQVTDTVVSLLPSNKNVVIEEYTGINCTNCPDGHKIANEVMNAHPGRVSVINIHQGSYAANTYTTQYGNQLAAQTGLTGYPAGTINRHAFSEGVTNLNRSYWPSAANTILNEASPVNIAAWGTLDMSTGVLDLTVQLYYTSNAANSTNLLNVAVIQDNVIGSQVGMSTNPNQVLCGKYKHMHMLRDLITGQWGDTVYTTTAGSFVEKHYTYTIPSTLGSPALATVLSDMHFVAFVTETHQEILTGVTANIEQVNLPDVALNAWLLCEGDVHECEPLAQANITINNWGKDTVTAMTFQYKVASGNYQTYEWTGALAPQMVSEISLPAMTVTPNASQTIKTSILTANGEPVNSSELSLSVKSYLYGIAGPCHFVLTTDRYGSETTFKIFDPNGNVVLQGGPFANLSASGTAVHEYDFVPTMVGCYRLEVYDEYGDGINSGYGAGNFKLYKADGTTLIFSNNGKFGAKAVYKLNVSSTVGVEDRTQSENIVIYPNPTTSQINIESNAPIMRAELYNLQGQLVQTQEGDVHTLNLNVSNGIYMLKVTTEQGSTVQKIVKQ